MKSSDNNMYLLHIKEAIKKINTYSKNTDFQSFRNNEMMQDAIIRQLSVIGEAAGNLSEEFKSSHKNIEWRYLIGMRNRLIINYIGVDLSAVWETVIKDIPLLEKQINK